MKVSIRGLLYLHVAIAVILATSMFVVSRVRSRSAVVKLLRSNGFSIDFDHFSDDDLTYWRTAQTQSAAWLGKEGVAPVYRVKYNDRQKVAVSVDVARGIRAITEVRTVVLEGADWLTDQELQSLSVCCDIRVLNVSETKVTSSGIRWIEGLPFLQSLFLDETEVDDDCVPMLCRMSQLQLLSIRGTRISAKGIAKLEASLPGCVVRFDEDTKLSQARNP